jgi:geranylgeranyl diphosphate synthase, type II
MELAAYLREKQIFIEDGLKEIFSSLKTSPAQLRDAMSYMLFSHGKRIRPILALAVCEAQNRNCDDILPFACAIEMIHTYSLIHDDLPNIDNDDMRRGKPTCHKVYGEAMALLAGDGLLTEAFRIMSDARYIERINPKLVRQIIFEIATASGSEGMVAGQVMDILYDGKEGTKNILDYIHSRKTTALIRASVRVGAIMGGAKAGALKKFTQYGECIGLAFQIMDDLLDEEGDEDTVGKRLHKDTNKQTYVKHYGVTASRIKLEQLTDEAVRSVQFLGEKSQILTQIAQFIGNRVS